MLHQTLTARHCKGQKTGHTTKNHENTVRQTATKPNQAHMTLKTYARDFAGVPSKLRHINVRGILLGLLLGFHFWWNVTFGFSNATEINKIDDD